MTSTKVPLLGGIVAPVNENPSIVLPPVERLNPFDSALPPETPVISIPSISN